MTEENVKVTAAAVLIGNELLSGRIADENMHYIANSLVEVGITLTEVRVIPDDCDAIITTVNELRARCDYVFTTGGIGPTHDDITAKCIAKAFAKPLIEHPEVGKSLRAFFESKGVDANPERMRMANMPESAEPLRHEGSPVPGFVMENVYVLAGVPRIMRSMLDAAIPLLHKGMPTLSVSVRCDVQEGTLAKGLAMLQSEHPDVDIGSYPLSREFNFNVTLVVRGTDEKELSVIADKIEKLIGELHGTVILRE